MYDSKQTVNRTSVRKAFEVCRRNIKEGEIARLMTDEKGNIHGYCSISILEWARLHGRD